MDTQGQSWPSFPCAILGWGQFPKVARKVLMETGQSSNFIRTIICLPHYPWTSSQKNAISPRPADKSPSFAQSMTSPSPGAHSSPCPGGMRAQTWPGKVPASTEPPPARASGQGAPGEEALRGSHWFHVIFHIVPSASQCSWWLSFPPQMILNLSSNKNKYMCLFSGASDSPELAL